jgi:hypothetical protein
MLDVDHLVETAQQATGLADFGESTWREGCERLVDALAAEARLNTIGEQIAEMEIVAYLTNRMRVTDWHRRESGIGRADVRPPIVIVGQGRTGTTILYDLLAQDPSNRVPRTWEVDRPWPPPETATYDTDPRIDEVQATIEASESVIPGFLAMHPIGARLGQECVRITGGAFRSMIFPTQYRIPSYLRWLLDEADMAPAYRYHRRFLQHLQSRHRGDRWVLKSPGHIWSLGALLAEYPGALLVQTHRDPLRIVASLASLVALLRRLASDESSVPGVAAELADDVADGLDRSVTARLDGTVRPDRAVDVQFAAFMADPLATVRTIYDRLGMALGGVAEARMRAFLDANPQDKHGGHRYTFAATGLDAGALRERVRRYQTYFDVASEPLP